jgi:peptide/nickel transport system substrate-binding protein
MRVMGWPAAILEKMSVSHREATFATVHAVAPFYSVLIRVNPENPASTTDFVCDVCTEIPEPADSGRTYAFPIRDDVRFEDGSVLTAYDVAARAGTRSSTRRKA